MAATLGMMTLYPNGGTISWLNNGIWISAQTAMSDNFPLQDEPWVADGITFKIEREGYNLILWAKNIDGTGTNYLPGDDGTRISGDVYYAIWEKIKEPLEPGNLNITYKGSYIKTLSETQTFKLSTTNKFLQDDLLFEVEFPELDTSDATLTAAGMRAGKTAYGPNGKMIGIMPNYEGQVTINEKTNGGN